MKPKPLKKPTKEDLDSRIFQAALQLVGNYSKVKDPQTGLISTFHDLATRELKRFQ